jgi:hypothetical protein
MNEPLYSRRYMQIEDEIRNAARARVGWHFSPKSLVENDPDAFAIWLVTYMSLYVPEIEEWQPPVFNVIVSEKRGQILVPAGTMKTTIGAICYPIWRICGNPNLEIAVVCKTDDEAISNIRAVRHELEANEDLIRDYGPFVPNRIRGTGSKWTDHRLNVAKRTRRSKQASMMYFGYGASIIGQRFDIGIVDDIVTPDIGSSPVLTRKQIQWFQTVFETGPYAEDTIGYKENFPEGNQILNFATRMSNHDLTKHLETRIPEEEAIDNPYIKEFKTIVVDLIKDEERQETISKRWPWKKAMAKKAEIGTTSFNMRYRNKISNDDTAIFKRVWLVGGEYQGIQYKGCYDKTLTFGEVIQPGDMVAIGYDPQSGSKSRYSKEAAIVVLANRAGEWRPKLVDYFAGQIPILEEFNENSQFKIIVRFAKEARINNRVFVPVVILEGNHIQQGLRQLILDEAQRQNVDLRVITTNTGADRHDPETGVEACAIDFENGWLRIPAMYESDLRKIKQFENAMIEYGSSGFLDIPIAYWKARKWLYSQRIKPEPRDTVLDSHLPTWMKVRMERKGMRTAVRVVDAYSGGSD